jgi:glutathione S-transferase
MIIYGDLASGNCPKVKWTADLLGLPYDWVATDIMKGESRTPDYLAKFPQGQVPAVAWPPQAGGDGRTRAQSNEVSRVNCC